MRINVQESDFDEIIIVDDNGEYTTFNLPQELHVNEYALEQEYIQQPAKYAYWASILAKMQYYLEGSERELDYTKANLEPQAREWLRENGTPKPTVSAVESKIVQDAVYQEKLQKVEAYKYYVDRLKYIVKSFEQRKDMLIQYGAQKRKEKDYGTGERMQG